MSLKKRIETFLEARDKSLDDLAEYLELTLDELERALSSKSLEVRTLENISKALRIPLYSFFPSPPLSHSKKEIAFYTSRLPKDESELTEEQVLIEEIGSSLALR